MGAKASRRVGTPNKRLEGDINQFLKPEGTKETRGKRVEEQRYLDQSGKRPEEVQRNGKGKRTTSKGSQPSQYNTDDSNHRLQQ